ncbi:MAG: ABC transporter ATP-binding protein [Thermaceae bacterium]|nr:ABC transporter ATP-binding protein [Thermaceae bacterium]
MALLELTHLQKQYANLGVVRDLNLEVAEGEVLCLLGPSGCGKTTTLRMVAGFLQPDGGDIRMDGKSLLRLPPERRPTGMVFQRYTLWPHMSVWHNVAFGLGLRRRPRAEIEQRVKDVLELVGLPEMARRYPAQLSGGQQQRIALARALVLEPRLLLLDEPFANLDAQLRERMRDELLSLQRRVGITMIFVTHDQAEALVLAHRIAVMREGNLEQIAAPDEIYNRPATRFVAAFVGTMNLLEGKVSAGQVIAGPFRFPVPSGLKDGETVTLAIRPEDLAFASGGFPVRTVQVANLGHYRRATLQTSEGGELLAFTGGEIPSEGLVQASRVLVYGASGKLAGVLEPQALAQVKP